MRCGSGALKALYAQREARQTGLSAQQAAVHPLRLTQRVAQLRRWTMQLAATRLPLLAQLAVRQTEHSAQPAAAPSPPFAQRAAL